MGERGPAPKPTIIQIKKGDPGKRARRAINKEPSPPCRDIICPDILDDEARKEWKRVMEMFEEMELCGQRVITEADVAVLTGYCQSWSDWVRYTESNRGIDENGKVVSQEVIPIYEKDPTAKDGRRLKYLQQSPFVGMRNKALLNMIRLAAQLGFTPAARTRVQAIPLDGVSDLEKEIFG